MMMSKPSYVFFCLVIIYSWVLPEVMAQTYWVHGVVRNESTDELLPYVNVLIEGTNKWTGTRRDGTYELHLSHGGYKLIVSSIGFKSITIPVEMRDSSIELDVSLVPTDYLLQEVTVYAVSAASGVGKPMGNISLQSEEVKQISGIFRDVFRVLQALPGISVDNELSAKFNVRGGNYDENLVLVNGTQVYDPYHIKEAPQASIGIFNVDLMKRVNMITGGFSPEYGDKMSSVLNIEYREGNRERLKGSASLSITDVNLLLEGPMTSDGSFVIGARKSYLEYVLELFPIKKNIHPSFYDIQGTANYDVTGENKLSFQFIHAGDNFELDPTLTLSPLPQDPTIMQDRFEEQKARYLTSLLSVSSSNLLGKSALLSAQLSYYNESEQEQTIDTLSQFPIGRPDSILYGKNKTRSNDLRIITTEGKTEFAHQITAFHELKTGLSLQSILYRQETSNFDMRRFRYETESGQVRDSTYEASPSDAIDDHVDANSFKIAWYLQDTWQISDEVIVNFGGRIDYFDFNKDFNFSPRLSLSYVTSVGTIMRAAWGFYCQSPIFKQLKFPYATSDNTKAQRATHYILGLEHRFSDNFTLKVEAYYKRYDNLISSERSSYWYLSYSKENDAVGFAKGIDLYAVVNFPDFYGWLSYGLLSAQEDNRTDMTGYYPRYTDQRHTLSAVLDFTLGNRWSWGLRVFYGSGYAYTPKNARYNTTDGGWEWITGDKNSAHYPDYRRIDLRLSKEFEIGSFPLLAFIDVINVFDFQNVLAYRYTYDKDGRPTVDEIELFPIIPTAGLTIRF
jgi:outer membrane receptor for ferrienterochelin and colicin